MKNTALSLAACVAFTVSAAGGSNAQPESPPALPSAAGDDVPWVPHALPPHLQGRVDETEEEAGLLKASAGGPLRQFVLVSKRWDPGVPIQVCFFGGTAALRSRVAAAASRWEQIGAAIQFDFGDRSDPRLCHPRGRDQIRIDFRGTGYWSLLGKDSVTLAEQHQPSMNFAYFRTRPPESREFNRLVMHEFGHALGFQHEHQHPWSKCEEGFDLEGRVYPALVRGDVLLEDVKSNMLRISYYEGEQLTPFDLSSIMLYTFPVTFYRDGERSACFHKTNHELSPGDIAAAIAAYPQPGQAPVQQAQIKVLKAAAFAELRDLVRSDLITADQARNLKTDTRVLELRVDRLLTLER